MHLREVHLKVVSGLLVLQREALPEAQFLEDLPREHVADASEGYLSALGVAGLHAHLGGEGEGGRARGREEERGR